MYILNKKTVQFFIFQYNDPRLFLHMHNFILVMIYITVKLENFSLEVVHSVKF